MHKSDTVPKHTYLTEVSSFSSKHMFIWCKYNKIHIEKLWKKNRSRYSDWLWAGWPRGPGRVKNFLFSMSSRLAEVHSTSYPMGTGGSFPGGKAAGAWSWPLTSKHRDNFTLPLPFNLIDQLGFTSPLNPPYLIYEYRICTIQDIWV
jgi:hypothetical protein